MGREWKLIKRASKDLELARAHRSEGNSAVAAFLYNRVVEDVLRALYVRKNGRDAPKDVSLEYLASRTKIPSEVSDYISSVMEPVGDDSDAEELGSIDVAKERQGGSLLYLDELAKRLVDCAKVYQ